jgi:hypothetical protein
MCVEQLLSDEDIARILKVSRSWMRQQRFKRRRHEPHFLDIDSVNVGGLPRYRLSDFEDFQRRHGLIRNDLPSSVGAA